MVGHSKEEHHWRAHNGRHLSDICCELLILKEAVNCLGCCSWCGGGDVAGLGCLVLYICKLLMHKIQADMRTTVLVQTGPLVIW